MLSVCARLPIPKIIIITSKQIHVFENMHSNQMQNKNKINAYRPQ